MDYILSKAKIGRFQEFLAPFLAPQSTTNSLKLLICIYFKEIHQCVDCQFFHEHVMAKPDIFLHCFVKLGLVLYGNMLIYRILMRENLIF